MKKGSVKIILFSVAVFMLFSAGCKIDTAPGETTSDTTPPGEISSMKAVPGNGKITLSWDEPGDSDYAGASVYNGSTLVYKVKKNTTSVIITELTNGTAYTLTVKTYDTSGNESQGTVVTVTPVSNGKLITAFSFETPAAEGTIDSTQHLITVTVPYGTDVTKLVAAFSITGTSLSVGNTVQKSGSTANDFSKPLTYTVTAADGTTQNYTVTVTTNAPGVFTVSFNKNASDAVGSMNAETLTQGTGSNLTGCTYTRTGYAFAGWAETPAGTVAYADGTTYTMGASNVILYAVWTPVSYTITYGNITNDSTNSNPATYTIETATITLADPVRSGYAFGGWYGSTTFGADKKVTQIAKGTTGNIALYAQWTPDHGISATVSIPDGTITFSPESPTVTKGSSLTLSVSETSYSSYTWYLDGNEQSPSANSATLTLDTGSLSAGIHTIQLVVTDSDGNASSGLCRFSVTN
jgi:uncharacterized repeat protein (TIGR02543 family)